MLRKFCHIRITLLLLWQYILNHGLDQKGNFSLQIATIPAIFFILRLAVLAAKSLRKLLKDKDAFYQAWHR